MTFLSSRVAPSRQLLAVAADEIRDREQFVLLDEQQVAYNLVLHATEAAGRATRRRSSSSPAGPEPARA